MNWMHSFQTFLYWAIISVILGLPPHVLAEESSAVVEHESGMYYTIRKGDTLWDLSEKFMDTPWQWPGLWEENKQIANPHWIYPGERIRLIRKDGRDVLPSTDPRDKIHLSEKQFYYYALIDHVGFIKNEAIAPLGSIIKVNEDKVLIEPGDLIYIIESGIIPLKPGERYTIYRTMPPLEDKHTREYIGIQHCIIGTVKITKRYPNNLVGEVVGAMRSIRTGDFLMPYKKRSPEIPLTESVKGLQGRVLLSEENEVIFGDNSVAFINKGEKHGVEPGQIYSAYYQDEIRIDSASEEKIQLAPIDFAKLLVLHTEETTSTVLITNSDKELHAGDRFHTSLE